MIQSKLIRIARSQVAEIQAGGSSILLRKVRSLILLALLITALLIPTTIALAIVRLIRPVVLIRFGWLRADRIGHLASETEMYMSERDFGIQASDAIDIFFHYPWVSNLQLMKMWKRELRVSPVVQPLFWLNRRLPGGSKHTISIVGRDRDQTRDFHGLVSRSTVHLSFTDDEELFGSAALKEMGLPNQAPFVCFATRDSAFLNSRYPERDWSYHDYRDWPINNFNAATEALTRRGYFMIRMGAVVEEPLNKSNPMVIDYASEYRTDFLDIYLGAKCSWFLGGNTGINMVPMIFRKPVAQVNYIPLKIPPSWSPSDLFIPKKLWLRAQNRFMSFHEILESGVSEFLHTAQYQDSGIDTIGNSPEEIIAISIEMDERLNNTWQSTEEDEKLQQRFRSLFGDVKLREATFSRIGAEFLRQNRELLD